jgi:hypothetical protein
MPISNYIDILLLLDFQPAIPGGATHSQTGRDYIAQTIFSIYVASAQSAATMPLRAAIDALSGTNKLVIVNNSGVLAGQVSQIYVEPAEWWPFTMRP